MAFRICVSSYWSGARYRVGDSVIESFESCFTEDVASVCCDGNFINRLGEGEGVREPKGDPEETEVFADFLGDFFWEGIFTRISEKEIQDCTKDVQ